MKKNSLADYLFSVGILSLQLDYSTEDLLNNINYFKTCHKIHISEVTALELFDNYINGEVIPDEV